MGKDNNKKDKHASSQEKSFEYNVREIKKTLDRVYPHKEKGKTQILYKKIQNFIKVIGLPALILASILPIYELTKAIRTSSSNDLIVRTYRDFSNELLKEGHTDRAEKILSDINTNDRIDPRIHYSLAKINVQQSLLKGEDVSETEDLIRILILLHENSSILTGSYGEYEDYFALFLMLTEVYIAQGNYNLALTTLNEKKDLFNNASKEFKSEYLLKKGTIFVWEHKYEDALIHLDSAAKNVLRSNSKSSIIAEIQFQLAKNEQFKKEFIKAIELYKISAKLFNENNSERGQLKAFNNLGMIYYDREFDGKNHNMALDYYGKASSIAEKIDDLVALARAQYNVAVIKRQQGKYQEALQVYILSLENFKLGKNEYGVAISHSALGIIYKLLEYNEKAFYHSKTAFDKFIELKNINNLGSQAGTVADVSRNLGNERDFLIYDYLAFVYKRAANDSDYTKNLKILRYQKSNIDDETYFRYLQEAQNLARDINLKLSKLDIDLTIPNVK